MASIESRIWRPFTQMQTVDRIQEVESAKGANLYLKNGSKVIDAISSWWVITHGHCDSGISSAIANQSKKLDQILFANFTHEVAQELVSNLGDFLPDGLKNYFFTDNGSTAVEAAIKMVIQRWFHFGEKQRKVFLTFEKSYHGDTIGAMSVGGDSIFNDPYSDYLFKVKRLKQGTLSTESVDDYTINFLSEVSKNHTEIAGLIIEPLIQGAGGMIAWPKEALEIIGRECKKYDIPIIFDEVMTGFGRTGTMFACEQLTYTPDIICLSKGLTGGSLPLSLTITNDCIYNSFLAKDKARMFFHGHSFTGNPISCAAALANMKIFKKKDLSKEWSRIEKINKKRGNDISSTIIKDKRSCGTMYALELSDSCGYTSDIANEVSQYALERGVFLRPLGSIIYVLPPYSITNGELDHTWDVIEDYCKSKEER